MEVSAYKSPKKAELYLFVPKAKELDALPDELYVMFGTPEHVVDFELGPGRTLARADAEEVQNALESKGYYLQMPPNENEILSDMPAPPEHLDNIF
ncbi:YcgL domain-containing protein [Thiomicrospira sp. WB1]|jgi:uncharacterized protein YcgL (UPF0745 family)|uniref:YcgL domain-containing protein n=1 Tax=Thiomicrospira sp. WB1 TaxID=1685380 RepID=UPI000748DBD3|nr:YcgL domain-containing protein [Thiomicrospira sp. WB1]KUJ71172.1 hypothetical protein AVO41_09920 [Thiomicrospira sp. WB1]